MKLVLTAVMAMTAATAFAAGPVPAPDSFARFASEVDVFARPRSGEIHGATTLFVGSSSIRMWDVARSFPKADAVNRGFGGATVVDVLHYYDRVIAGVQPASVIVYVGENDIAGGAAADRVATDVLTLLTRLRADMPRARIAYMSMKPTPLRWDIYARMSAANAAIKAHAGPGRFDYLDVGGAMLTAEGRPDAQLFGMDGLHMNERGYGLWTGIVDRYLAPMTPMNTAAARTVS